MSAIKQSKKAEAVLSLDDELTSIKLDLERAELVLSDVCYEYFCKLFDPNDKDDVSRIVYDHARYKIMAEIVSDYLFSIRETLQKIIAEGEGDAA